MFFFEEPSILTELADDLDEFWDEVGEFEPATEGSE